jgi:hypothetical protein
VKSIAPVAGYANMFNDTAGSQMEVIVPNEKVGALKVGEPTQLRIRRAGPATIIGE